jgi:hypothetical protein
MLVFVDAHYMMALAAADRAGADEMLRSARGFSAAPGTEAAVMRDVGEAVCAALLAHRRGEFGRVVDLLLPVRRRIRTLGGSHAQRDVFAQTLLDAALRAGRPALARALASERIEQRRESPWSWRAYARALEGAGDPAGAAVARGKAERRLQA